MDINIRTFPPLLLQLLFLILASTLFFFFYTPCFYCYFFSLSSLLCGYFLLWCPYFSHNCFFVWSNYSIPSDLIFFFFSFFACVGTSIVLLLLFVLILFFGARYCLFVTCAVRWFFIWNALTEFCFYLFISLVFF